MLKHPVAGLTVATPSDSVVPAVDKIEEEQAVDDAMMLCTALAAH
jgi:hypothetical protein